MTFSDIFKSSFLANVTAVSMFDMVLALLLAFAVGVFIYLIYKMTYAGVMYSSTFGVTLVSDAGGSHNDYNARDSGSDQQRSSLPWYGWCIVHRPFQDSN